MKTLNSTLRQDTDDIRTLAGDLGLPFREHGLVPAPHVAFSAAFASGIAELDPARCGYRLAMSPSALQAEQLRSVAAADIQGVAIMPRAAFRTMLREACREANLDHASHHLARSRPGLSALAGATRRQKQAAILLGFVVPVVAWASPGVGLGILAVLAMPIFFMLVLLRLGAVIDAMAPAQDRLRRLADVNLPFYTVLVPLCREAAVVTQLVEGLARFDYPVDRLEIKFLIEEDDEQTAAAFAERTLPPHMEVVVAPRGEPRTKPRALNFGLLEARGELIAIYDAEDRPDPRQLRLAANLFGRLPRRVVCLQGRLVIDNADDSILTRLFALEYAGLFDVLNAGLIRLGLPVLLGGTSNHFRTAELRALGGWDAWNVTEDADLAFRLVRAGYLIRDLPSATLEEAPASFGIWFRQRVRWLKGFAQTVATHSRDPAALIREAGAKPALALLSLCAGTLLSALGYPLFIGWSVVVLIQDGLPEPTSLVGLVLTTLWLTLFCFGLLVMIAPLALGARHRGLDDLLWWLPLAPFYYLLVSAAAWAAMVEYVRAPTRWNKTEHGLARTSRQARP